MITRWFTPGRNALVVAVLVSLVALPAGAQRHGGSGMGAMRGMRSQMNGTRHDSARGADMSLIHELILHHDRITRSVTNIPNGIRTVTESDDSLLTGRIKQHASTMTARVASGKDPGWPMESEALRTLYKNSALIRTRVESTAKGIFVEQTSTDSATINALQTHAAEVTALVEGGMEAMHAAMMRNRGGMMPGSRGMMQMHGPNHRGPPDSLGTRPAGPPAHAPLTAR
jgi:hypothetical protein